MAAPAGRSMCAVQKMRGEENNEKKIDDPKIVVTIQE
jgi:hypothetical protein